jgi:glycosyltransferase involved in cell wall biosynthesis
VSTTKKSPRASAAQRLRYAAFPRGSRRERLARWLLHQQRQLVFRTQQGLTALARVIAFKRSTTRIRHGRTIAHPESSRPPAARLPAGRRLRILFQADDFLQGGLEHVVLDLYSTLDPSRFEAALLVLGQEGPAAAAARERGLPVLRLPDADRQRAYRDLLSQRQVDVVNAHYSDFGAHLAADLGVPFVQTIHNTYVWLSPQQAAQLRAADAHTAGYICVSNAVAAYSHVRLGLPAAKMIVIPNGINTQALDSARGLDRPAERRALGFAPDDFVFLCTASLTEVKAQLFLIRALAAARCKNPRIRLALLGRPQESLSETSYAQLVQREIGQLGVGNAVTFLGYHERPQKFYYLTDAFVLPSFIEGWSLALAEALYAGLPVIASDVGAARELLTRTGGRLLPVPYGSLCDVDEYRFYNIVRAPNPQFVEELAAALVATAENPQAPSLSEDLRRSFAREQAYQSYARIYEWSAAGGAFAAARHWAP